MVKFTVGGFFILAFIAGGIKSEIVMLAKCPHPYARACAYDGAFGF